MARKPLALWILQVYAGLLIWGMQFAIGYSLAALACARGWQAATMLGIPVVRTAMLLTVAGALAGCSLLFFATLARIRHAEPEGDRTAEFLHAISCGIAVFAFIGIAWTALIIPVPLQCVASGAR